MAGPSHSQLCELRGPFYRGGQYGSERGRDLPKATQQKQDSHSSACSLGLLHKYYQLRNNQVPNRSGCIQLNPSSHSGQDQVSTLQGRGLRLDSGSICPRSHSQRSQRWDSDSDLMLKPLSVLCIPGQAKTFWEPGVQGRGASQEGALGRAEVPVQVCPSSANW